MSTDDPLWPSGYDRVILNETDSTMAEARRRADTLTGPTWVLARHQRAAHGRRGRPWSNLEGNFAATLVYRPGCALEEAALRSFVASISLYYALGRLVDPARLSLKWPNDVLLDDSKVAGILLEAMGPPEDPVLSIGIGVNLAKAPQLKDVEDGATPPISVAGAGGRHETPEAFLSFLAGLYDQHERLFLEFGFDPIRRLWLKHAARLGQIIMARTGEHTFTGEFETVDATGHLVLKTGTDRRTIAAADVYF